MPNSRYSLHQYPVDALLNLIKLEEIAIPEIQRPFVWSANKVRDFIDSLYQGYPVGYLITWRKPDVPLRGGQTATRERIMIDGQQRMIALQTALLGREVLTKKYKAQRIQIAFHPGTEEFAVATRAIHRNPEWISDISTVFNSNSGLLQLVDEYCERNPGVDRYEIAMPLRRLYEIQNNPLGVVELSADLDIGTIMEIIGRMNKTGGHLPTEDFIKSRMASIDAS